jgi:hypothetical protein
MYLPLRRGTSDVLYQGTLTPSFFPGLPVGERQAEGIEGAKASIKKFVQIFQECALKKVHFYCLLGSANSTNKSLVRPYRRSIQTIVHQE